MDRLNFSIKHPELESSAYLSSKNTEGIQSWYFHKFNHEKIGFEK